MNHITRQGGMLQHAGVESSAGRSCQFSLGTGQSASKFVTDFRLPRLAPVPRLLHARWPEPAARLPRRAGGGAVPRSCPSPNAACCGSAASSPLTRTTALGRVCSPSSGGSGSRPATKKGWPFTFLVSALSTTSLLLLSYLETDSWRTDRECTR